MNITIPYLGEILSFGCAICWALAVVLFKKSGETLHPFALNLFKNVLAVILFLPTMYIFKESLICHASAWEFMLFFLSGAIGIGIGDSLFFKSLNKIGAGLSAIVDCLYSPFVIACSMLFLGEHLNYIQAIGVALIVLAVLLTINAKHGRKISRSELLWGIFWGVLAILAMSTGIVIIKPILAKTPLIWAIEVRLAGGVICSLTMLLFHPLRRTIIKSLFTSKGLGYTLSGSFMGVYLALILWMAGMKYTEASIASALNQTSNIFTFLFAALILKEHLTRRHIFAILLAVIGALMVAIM